MHEPVPLQAVQRRVHRALRQVEGTVGLITQSGDQRISMGRADATQRDEDQQIEVPPKLNT